MLCMYVCVLCIYVYMYVCVCVCVLRADSIGDVTSPWPCFMIATTKDYAEQHKQEIQNMLTVV